MMNKQRYITELNRVKAGEAFKQEARRLMLAAAARQPGRQAAADAPQPAARRPARRYMRYIATAAACLLLAVALGVAAVNMGPLFTGLGSAGGGAMQDSAKVSGSPEDGFGGMEGMESETAASSSASSAALAGGGLPKLELGPLAVGGMGFEGYRLYDFAEFGANSVWAMGDGQPQSMPVYRNLALRNQYPIVPEGAGYNEVEMEALGRWAASAIGKEVEEFERNMMRTNLPSEDKDKIGEEVTYLYSLTGTFESGGVWVQREGGIRIFWDEGYQGANGPLQAPADDAPREEHLAFVQRIIDELPGLFDYMNSPAPDATKQYDIYGGAMWGYTVYDAAGGTAEQILHHSADSASLAVDEYGTFYNAWIFRRDLSSFVADYPVISANEALAQVVAGNGLTTAPSAFPGADSVAAVDLVYYVSDMSDIFMPYYKIYALLDPDVVGLPEDSPDDLNTYGVWYYPAVSPEYLEILPEAEIYFNGGLVK